MTLHLQADTGFSTQTAAEQLRALLHDVAIGPIDDLGWIRVSGDDRTRWLNGMVTNSILDLKSDLAVGVGCYNFILSAQGRIQGTAYAFAQRDSILLETDRAQLAPLMATFDRFIIMDDVELTDVTATWIGVRVIGPRAVPLLQQIGLSLTETGPLSFQTIAWQGANVTVIHAHSPLVPQLELWSDSTTVASLTHALTTAGAESCGSQAIEWLRLLEGTPRYGVDIRDRELPQETSQTRALHFSKGCYLGQEIVERIHSRGNVHRTFTGFRVQGPLPAAGTPIAAEGKQIGELTSTATIPLATGTLQIGLGYIRRDVLDRALPLTYQVTSTGGSQSGAISAASLPFKDF